MRSVVCAALIMAGLVPAGQGASGRPALSVDELRVEYLVNPLGIDAERPRLIWMLSAGPRGRRQSAYQVLVASSPERLGKNKGDLWDSGKIISDQDTFVPYAGQPLVSGTQAGWKVRVWDQDGERAFNMKPFEQIGEARTRLIFI